jgi:biopolymer transport protein ExbB
MLPPVLADMSSVIQFFIQGGIFMALLLVCSLVSVAVIVLRALALRQDIVMPPEIEKEIDGLRHDDPDGVTRLSRFLRNDHSPMGRIASVGLQHLHWPKSENVEAVQTKARHEIVRLESGLFILEIIVGIAPLLGLLGAVSGLVKVFGAFGDSAAQSDPHVIAKGISEALSTTIVGLAIAIPSLIAYSYLSKKVETMAAEMESLIADLLAKCYFQKQRRYSARVSPPPEPVAPGSDYQGYSGSDE